jgi:hypothetical protein
MTKPAKPTTYAFIDSQNVNLAIQSLGWKLDWSRFRVHLRDKYAVTTAYVFVGYIPTNQPLYTSLQQAGFVLIFKPTLTLADGTVKGNVDAELVLQAMIDYPNYDQAVIITGDGDFYCLVKYLNEHHKLGRLLVPNVKRYSKLLKPFAAGKIDFMNNLEKKLRYKGLRKNEN